MTTSKLSRWEVISRRHLEPVYEKTVGNQNFTQNQQPDGSYPRRQKSLACKRVSHYDTGWQTIFNVLLKRPHFSNPEQNLLLDAWPTYFLDYLQQLRAGLVSQKSLQPLESYLASESWMIPMEVAVWSQLP